MHPRTHAHTHAHTQLDVVAHSVAVVSKIHLARNSSEAPDMVGAI